MKAIDAIEKINSSSHEPIDNFGKAAKEQILDLEGFSGEQFNSVPIKLAVQGLENAFSLQNSLSSHLISVVKAKATSEKTANNQLNNLFAVANGLREVVPALTKLIQHELEELNGLDFANFSPDVMFLDSCVDGLIAACDLQYTINQAMIDQQNEEGQ